jgi:hypothetical protein
MPKITTKVCAALPNGNLTTFNKTIEHASYQQMKRRLDRLLHLHQVVMVFQVISGPRTVMMEFSDPTKNYLDNVRIEDPEVAYSYLENGTTLNVACVDR